MLKKIELWNDLSVRQKIFIMFLLPTLLILALAFRQVNGLNEQLDDLKKAQRLALYSAYLSDLHTLVTKARSSSTEIDITPLSAQLSSLTSDIFSQPEQQQLKDLIADIVDSADALKQAIALDERIESIDWQAESYQNILLTMEKEPFRALPTEVAGHLQALYQIEWLMFWAEEEIWSIQTLLTGFDAPWLYEQLTHQIEQLVSNQQLFVARFIAINANESQVNLLLDTFTEPAFENSSDFRNQILAGISIGQLSEQQRNQGLASLQARLLLLDNVSNAIESELRNTMTQAVIEFENQRLLFVFIVVLMTCSVIVIGMNLSHRIVNNLNLVLRYLDGADKSQSPSLIEQIKGRDEVSRFAHEVERLTQERIEGEQKLLAAKDEADKEREKAVMASRAKSSFLANMSHEIRTPLNGVIGISEVLAETDLDATQKDYVDTIETSSALLLSLINDILDFSKIESGMLQINAHSTQIRETIYDIAAIVAPKIKEKALALNVDIDVSVPCRILIDDHRLRQVLMNFMSNAVKFTQSGSVTIAVHTLSKHDKSALLRFEVIDSGIGIDKERQDSIFEAFAQEDSTTTRQFGGTGLGLAISTQLIELMGGKIQLDSEKGSGSRFFFDLNVLVDQYGYQTKATPPYDELILVCEDKSYQERLISELNYFNLPVTRVVSCLEQVAINDADTDTILLLVELSQPFEHQAIARLQQQQNSKACLIRQLDAPRYDFKDSIAALVVYPLLGYRLYKAIEACSNELRVTGTIPAESHSPTGVAKVLLVEDNIVNQKVASLHLKKLGCDFDVASNGQEAVQMFTANRDYDLILMDCMMPVMDGFEATKQIRHCERVQHRAPIQIIALTASVVDDDIQLCFDCGMNDYIPKPFKADILKHKIRDATTSISVLQDVPPKTDQDAPEVLLHSQQHTSHKGYKARILLVEDNLVNQKVAALHLQKAGFDYVIAGDGEQALQTYMHDQNFELILMDCMMPVKDGFSATEDIRRFEKQRALQPIPIIALTASVVDDDIQKCYDSGMNGYVPKPVRREKLLQEIESLI